MPDRSGLPDAVVGAGAFRFGLPSDPSGTPSIGRFFHCAPGVAVSRRVAQSDMNAQPRTAGEQSRDGMARFCGGAPVLSTKCSVGTADASIKGVTVPALESHG